MDLLFCASFFIWINREGKTDKGPLPKKDEG